MTKTLIVSYAPRIGSYTKVLLDEFERLSNEKTEITHLDLVATPPDLLSAEHLALLMQWNTGKRGFTKEEEALMANHNEIIELLLDADQIVLATPIYNFSIPATVKAWIDAIVVSDRTFIFDPAKGFAGSCGNKKALVLMVSGFDYQENAPIKEYATATLKENFAFMGIPVEVVTAFGVDEMREQLDDILDTAKRKIEVIVNSWF